jgi:ABC-type Fe3+ transport system permease subunit
MIVNSCYFDIVSHSSSSRRRRRKRRRRRRRRRKRRRRRRRRRRCVCVCGCVPLLLVFLLQKYSFLVGYFLGGSVVDLFELVVFF